MPYKSQTAKQFPLISVSGNKFANTDGDINLFRGLTISDSDKWVENFGFAAGPYPIIATEIGFVLHEGDVIDKYHYGFIIIN